jgi:hypothetical protein
MVRVMVRSRARIKVRVMVRAKFKLRVRVLVWFGSRPEWGSEWVHFISSARANAKDKDHVRFGALVGSRASSSGRIRVRVRARVWIRIW